MSQFASATKLDWSIDPDALAVDSERIAKSVAASLRRKGVNDDRLTAGTDKSFKLRELPSEAMDLLLGDSISPLPLHKCLVLRDAILASNKPFKNHQLLALSKAAVTEFSNLHFGPEVGVTSPKRDARVIEPWLRGIYAMRRDLRHLAGRNHVLARAIRGDSRKVAEYIGAGDVAAVITSPPYPNEKDYTRTTRLESVLLGLINTKAELQAVKKALVRSNTRSVYKADEDHMWVKSSSEIQRIALEIEARRIHLKKTSGFERLYARVTQLYFGGMTRHLESLKEVLRPGAQLAYVVGDQASYLRIMIRTGQLLAEIAEKSGYRVVRIDLFRTRIATATKEQLREEVVILEWPGTKHR